MHIISMHGQWVHFVQMRTANKNERENKSENTNENENENEMCVASVASCWASKKVELGLLFPIQLKQLKQREI